MKEINKPEDFHLWKQPANSTTGILTHTINDEIIRRNDIRGIINETLFIRDAYFIGLSFAHNLLDQGGQSVIVGYDGRHSSPKLETALVRGLVDGGAAVTRIGLGPTPMLYYSVHHTASDAGIMVTGSHNAASYNGFKFTLKDRPFFGEDLKRLAALSSHGLFKTSGGSLCDQDLNKNYTERLLRAFREKKSLSAVWDPGNGAAGEIIQDLVSLLPGKHLIINGKIDGDFPNHHPDPTIPANMEQLRSTVLKHEFDIGVAFDGDGDRIGVINNQGGMVWADQLLTLFSQDILTRHPGATFIADVKTSQTYFDHIKEKGGKPIIWNTGRSLIRMKMLETGALLAGEMSGHIFFADTYYGYDDALYAAIRLLTLLSASEGSLSDLCDTLPKAYATPEIRIPCPEEQKPVAMERIIEMATKSKGEFLSIDGIRVSNDTGWWLMRPSGTEPVLVARCEAESMQELSLLTQNLQGLLKNSGIHFNLNSKL